MSSPWEEVRRESLEVPSVGYHRPGSPLPWLLLTVSLTLTISILIVGRNRLTEEKERTWVSLKANDDLNHKLKATQTELEKLQEECRAGTAGQNNLNTALNKKIVDLELNVRRLQDELAHAAAKKK